MKSVQRTLPHEWIPSLRAVHQPKVPVITKPERTTAPNDLPRFDYFEAYSRQIGFAEELVLNLKSAIAAGELGTRELMQAMHTIENDADQVNHVIHAHLRRDYEVPLDRMGMGMLANTLDSVVDAFEDISIRAYYFHIDHLHDSTNVVLEKAAGAIADLKRAIDMLPPEKQAGSAIVPLLVSAQTAESDCDTIYVEAMHDLYEDKNLDPEYRRILHAMSRSLEEAVDTIESAAECIEEIVKENV
jgi:uncharacterized protein